jgi:hypothetical protein
MSRNPQFPGIIRDFPPSKGTGDDCDLGASRSFDRKSLAAIRVVPFREKRKSGEPLSGERERVTEICIPLRPPSSQQYLSDKQEMSKNPQFPGIIRDSSTPKGTRDNRNIGASRSFDPKSLATIRVVSFRDAKRVREIRIPRRPPFSRQGCPL